MMTSVLLLVTLVRAFFLPSTVYTDLTAASSYFSFGNWVLILLAFAVWFGRDREVGQTVSVLSFAPPYGAWFMAAAILTLGSYSVTAPAFQPGFYVFLALSVAISGVWVLFLRRRPMVV